MKLRRRRHARCCHGVAPVRSRCCDGCSNHRRLRPPATLVVLQRSTAVAAAGVEGDALARPDEHTASALATTAASDGSPQQSPVVALMVLQRRRPPPELGEMLRLASRRAQQQQQGLLAVAEDIAVFRGDAWVSNRTRSEEKKTRAALLRLSGHQRQIGRLFRRMIFLENQPASL